MQLPRAKNEVNVNTVITIIGFLVTIAGGGVAWGTAQANIATLTTEQAELGTRMTTAEGVISRLVNLEYRVTVAEQANTNLARAVDELRAAVANQSADIRIVREIVTRMDRQLTDGK